MPISVRLKVAFTVVAASAPLLIALVISASSQYPAVRWPLLAACLVWISFGVLALWIFIPQLDRRLIRARRARRGEKLAIITFDDGPDEPWTGRILDILKAEGVLATFFMLGIKAQRHPELVRRIAAEGHEIGNHTMSHAALPLRPRARIRDEIDGTNAIIASLTGKRPTLFRAPRGFRWFGLARILKDSEMQLISWTKGVWDTDVSDADAILKKFRAKFSDPEILLLHDGEDESLQFRDRSATVAALPRIIGEYRRRGYRFATVGELFATF